MRTPYQIKRALAMCRDDRCICDECIFSDGNVKKWRSLMSDALIYIEQLEKSVDAICNRPSIKTPDEAIRRIGNLKTCYDAQLRKEEIT